MSAKLRRIFVVFKTHFDMGFTGLIEEVLESYARSMIPQALDACRQSGGGAPGHRFVWTLPAWPLTDSMARLRASPLCEELERRVAEGRITWHALPFTTHTELFGLEDFIRGLYVGRALGERFGRAAIAAKMTDVPGHTWILPTLLASAGVRFLHLGCNSCSTPPDVPFLFRWEGPDGSRVMTMYSRGGYGTTLFPPPGWNLPIWLALQHTSDNVGPQRAAAVDQILTEARERFPDVDVTIGSLDDFARELVALEPELPVVRKDLADSWIHGIAAMPAEVAKVRRLRNRLVSVESAMATYQLAHGNPAAPEDSFRAALSDAYAKILLFGEHTWSIDTKLALNPPEFGGRVYVPSLFQRVRSSGKYDRIQRSWADKADFVSDAEKALLRAESMLPGGTPGAPTAPSAPPTVPARFEVVNHHLWQWDGLLRIGSFDTAVKATTGSDGAVLPTFLIDGSVWVALEGIPPLSSTILSIDSGQGGARAAKQHSPARAAPRAGSKERGLIRTAGSRIVMENGRLRIEVDRSSAGVIALVDRATGRNWVDTRRGMPFGGYRYDVFSRQEIVAYLKSYAYDLQPWFLDDFGKPGYPDMEHRTFTGKLEGVESETAQGWARLSLVWRQERESVGDLGNAACVVQRISMFENQPWVDMDFRLEGKQESPLLEAGHIVLPIKAEKARYAFNKTGSVVDPAADIARNANRLLHCCDRWVDIADGGSGLLVIPYDSPLFSIGSMAIERFDGAAKPGAPVLYFNLFNTQWGTNFPQWIGGTIDFRFRLIPHEGNWRRARAWEHAAGALQPPLCFPSQSEDRRPEAELLARGLLEKPSRGLQIVTLKGSEKGDGLIFRLQEPTGRGGTRTLRFRLAAGTPTPGIIRCSLLEDEQEVLKPVRSGDSLTLAFPVRPFEVVTLKLKF